MVSPSEYNDLRKRVQEGKDVDAIFSKARQVLPKQTNKDSQSNSMDMAVASIDLDSFSRNRKKGQGRSNKKGRPPRRKNKRR